MKPIASLSLDLDDLWTYLMIHGEKGWEEMPSYLGSFVPMILDLLDELGLTITFFIVGRDAARTDRRPLLRSIAERGHDIANHSFRHEPWLHVYTEAALDAELARSEEAIEAATGCRPLGFRGPGFSLSAEVLAALQRRGYRYDASTLPMFLGPIARRYYFASAKLSAEERAKRSILFGRFRDGLRPTGTYTWQLAGGSLLEIPVTTMPGLRLPFHLSYLLYASLRSHRVAQTYLDASLTACRLGGVTPSLLLHPLDFLGGDEVPALAFFPAMHIEGRAKRAQARDLLARFAERYEVVTMAAHADAASTGSLVSRRPDFGTPFAPLVSAGPEPVS